MASNQYLPFGTAGGANVLTPSAYSGLAARLSGFTAGTAVSAQLNTVWRQSSVISAMMGEFILDYGGYDALDDGNVDNLETSFVRTLQKQPWNYAVAAGTANARTATLSPAPTAYIDGMSVTLRIAATNSAAATLNLNGLGVIPITLVSGAALTGGEIPAMAEFIIFNNTAMLVNPRPSVVTGIGGYQNIEAATNTTLPTNNVAVAVPWASATGSQSVFGTIAGSVFTFTVAGRYFLSSQMQISVTGTPTGQFAAAIARVIKNNGLPGQGTITTMGDDLTLIGGTATTSYLSGVGALDAAVNDTLILTGQEFIASGGTYTTGNIAVASITLLRTQ